MPFVLGEWCNGNTWVSKTFVEGSNPSSPAKKKKSRQRLFSFCTFHSALFTLRSSPRLFPVKSEERKEKRSGSFAPQSIDFFERFL